VLDLAARGVLLLYFGLGVDGVTLPSGEETPQSLLLEMRTNLLRLIDQASRDHDCDQDDLEYSSMDLLPLFKSAMVFLDAGINVHQIACYLSQVTLVC
jgi:hypothetical protein